MRFLIALLITALLSPALSAKDPLVVEVEAEAQRRAASEDFAGAVLIARAGAPFFQGAYGYANRETRTPNTLDTRFRFGSMGKMFTAVATLQLVQAGKLSLDAPLGKYLVDYPNKEVAAVTIEQLLTHTGGTGNIFAPEYFERRLTTREHTAAGGGYSTVGDLLKFMNGLNARRSLDAEHTGMLVKSRLPTARPGDEQALGFAIRTHPDGNVSLGHGGGAPGMNGELLYFPKSDYLVVVLSNLDPPGATALAESIVQRLPKQPK